MAKDKLEKTGSWLKVGILTVVAAFLVDIIVGIWYAPAVTWIKAVFP